MKGREKYFLSIFVLFFLLFPQFPCSATDIKTVDFLRKLNKYYYCVSREGLTGFICEGTLTISPEYKKGLIDLGVIPTVADSLNGQKFKLFVFHGKNPHLEWEVPTGTLSPAEKSALEEQAKNTIKDLEEPIDSWYEDVFEPVFTEDGMKERVCTVSNTEKGFVVDQKAEDGAELKMIYDPKAKLKEIHGFKNGKELVSAETGFIPGPNGFLLSIVNSRVPVVDLLETDRFSYQRVGKFFLLKTLVKEIQFGKLLKKGSALTLRFNNYVLQTEYD